MIHVLAAVLFFAPAGIANATPVFVSQFPLLRRWQTPLDLGKSWRGKRLFGSNKTWRGLVCGTLVGGLVAYLEAITVFRIDTSSTRLVAISVFGGMVMGFGALVGDAIESFFKRQVGIASGRSWFPFDQTDYIIGGLALSAPFVRVSGHQYIWIFVVWFSLHLIVSYIGYLVGLKDQPI